MLNSNNSLAETSYLSKKHVELWIKSGPTVDLIKQVENFGEYIAKTLKKNEEIGIKSDENVTSSQIRQIFGKLKSIETKGFSSDQTTEFLMLKPLLAYAVGRHKKTGLKVLNDRLSHGIDIVLTGEEIALTKYFKNFCKLFEAILSYHKAHGGD